MIIILSFFISGINPYSSCKTSDNGGIIHYSGVHASHRRKGSLIWIPAQKLSVQKPEK
jgi:hypothetical protein